MKDTTVQTTAKRATQKSIPANNAIKSAFVAFVKAEGNMKEKREALDKLILPIYQANPTAKLGEVVQILQGMGAFPQTWVISYEKEKCAKGYSAYKYLNNFKTRKLKPLQAGNSAKPKSRSNKLQNKGALLEALERLIKRVDGKNMDDVRLELESCHKKITHHL